MNKKNEWNSGWNSLVSTTLWSFCNLGLGNQFISSEKFRRYRSSNINKCVTISENQHTSNAPFDWKGFTKNLYILYSDINLDISLATTATLLASETRYQYIRCVAPSFRSPGDLLLAVGLANGKVGLCNFVSSNENNIEFSKFKLKSTFYLKIQYNFFIPSTKTVTALCMFVMAWKRIKSIGNWTW